MNEFTDKMNEEITEAKKEMEKKIETIKTEYGVKKCLADMGLPKDIDYKLFVHSLYGSDISITIEHNFYSYGEEKKQPDYDTVLDVSKILQPTAMTMVRDSCLSFRTRKHVDQLPEEKKEHWSEEIDIVPFLIEFDCFQHPTITFKWYAKLSNGITADVKIKLYNDNKIGRNYGVYKSYNRRVIDRLLDTRCDYNKKIETIFDDDGNALAGIARPIRWASGSASTPNRYTLYWEKWNEFDVPTVEDLLRPFLFSLNEKRVELVEHGLMLSDYFQGTSGVQLSVCVHPEMTRAEVIEALENEINCIYDHIQWVSMDKGFPEEFLEKAIEKRIDELKQNNKYLMDDICFPDMEYDEDEYAENAVFIFSLEFN